MKRIAIIKNGLVNNVAMWEADLEWVETMEDNETTLVDVTDNRYVGPGWTYLNGSFSPPPPEPDIEEPEPEL